MTDDRAWCLLVINAEIQRYTIAGESASAHGRLSHFDDCIVAVDVLRQLLVRLKERALHDPITD
jgi:hypothetical protein